MNITISVDIKLVKKAFALLEMDIPSDEEIEEKFKNVVVDLKRPDLDFRDAALGLAVLAIGTVYETP